MPLFVFNVTKNRLIRYPSEWEDGDEVWYSETDNTEPIWHNSKCGYWAHKPSSKNDSPTGKYGVMTVLHREGEMELFCKWVEADELLMIFPNVISCPYAKFCKKVSVNCTVTTKGLVLNLKKLFPDLMDFDPQRNLTDNFSCDALLKNISENSECGLECYVSSDISKRKSLQGIPMIEFKCLNQEQLNWLKKITKIDLSGKDEEALKNITLYNIGLLKIFTDQFPCKTETIIEHLHEEQAKLPHYNPKRRKIEAVSINPGLQPWDKWPFNPPKYKGMLVEQIFRLHKDYFDWSRNRASFTPALSRRSRERYGYTANSEELEIDKKIYNQENEIR